MPTQSESVRMNLRNKITVNGVSYGPGSVEVPRDQASDLERMDVEHDKYKNNLHVRNTYEVDAGTIAVGGGSE